jgi:glutamate synthase (NADPH) small chain
MANMRKDRVEMPEQDPKARAQNFEEVTYGYTADMAVEEATRCLNCKHQPCIKGCPVNVQIPEFIMLIQEGKFIEAYKKIIETNSLPAVCGRVCPQENQCELYCVRGIKHEPVAIGRLERYVADLAISQNFSEDIEIEKNGIQVAVVGSGPASLSCATDLAKFGYDVTMFEAFHTPGGVLKYGIPEFRLPKKLVETEINGLKKLGVKIQTNMVIGKILTLEDLKQMGYQSIFIGTGAGLPKFMNINGENLNGVFSSNEYLTRINLMKAYDFPNYDTPLGKYKNVAVVGGGNVAMDAARSALRMGAENVYIVYRRSESEMPARIEEIHHAIQEGVQMLLLNNPTEILGDEHGWVKGMRVIKMELGEPDDSGRRRPIEIKGSEYILDVDAAIISIGQSPNPLIKNTTEGLKTQSWGGIITDEATCATNIEGIYAGGDAVTGAATVILAMGYGKVAAKAMNEYMLKNKK